jgi:hypothetical protein
MGGGDEPTFSAPEVISNIEELMKHDTAGDPISGIKWSRCTTRKIAEQLATLGVSVSKNTVGHLLKTMDYRLRVSRGSWVTAEVGLTASKLRPARVPIATRNSISPSGGYAKDSSIQRPTKC